MRPNLIIIGGTRCGTTSLHNYLDFHPEISMSKIKETNFFSNLTYWRKGIKWYESNFQGKTKVHGESSTSYTNYPQVKGIPERMHQVVPDVKLVYILRDPIDRILSHYITLIYTGKEKRPIKSVLSNLRDNEYINQSMYYMQIAQYLKYYHGSNILILTIEDLKKKPQKTLEEVFKFLRIDAFDYPEEFFKVWNKGSEKKQKTWFGKIIYPRWFQNNPTIPWEIKAPFKKISEIGAKKIEQPTLDEKQIKKLNNCLKGDVQQLKKFTGKDFKGWYNYE